MKKKLSWIALLPALGLLVLPAMAGSQWETDFQKASESAKASHRYMLLDFSGSDWCGWCIKLDEEVFSKKEFKKYAEENLVCVLVDFPQGKALKKPLKEQNAKLAQTYGIRGYPSVIILSPDGEKVAQTGYQKGGAESYVTHLKGMIDPHRKKNNVPEPAAMGGLQSRVPARQPLQKTAVAKLPRAEDREMRAWTTKNGSTVTATLLEEKGPYMVLRKDDGTEVQVSKYSLSDDDQKYIAGLKAASLSQVSAKAEP